MKKNTIVITGGAGFVGTNLIEIFQKAINQSDINVLIYYIMLDKSNLLF